MGLISQADTLDELVKLNDEQRIGTGDTRREDGCWRCCHQLGSKGGDRVGKKLDYRVSLNHRVKRQPAIDSRRTPPRNHRQGTIASCVICAERSSSHCIPSLVMTIRRVGCLRWSSQQMGYRRRNNILPVNPEHATLDLHNHLGLCSNHGLITI